MTEQSNDKKAMAAGKLTVVEQQAPAASKPEASKPRPVEMESASEGARPTASRPSAARLTDAKHAAPKAAADKSATSKLEPQPPAASAAVQRPLAEPAQPRLRHIGLALSFLVLVLVPVLVTSWYLWTRAADQYASYLGFTVRTEQLSSPVDILGGLTSLSGGGSSDIEILYEFIRSREMVSRIDAEVDLQAMFSRENAHDPVFGFASGQPVEELLDYWNRMVRVDFDTASGLMEVRVLAFVPADAQVIARKIFDESSRVINDLSDIAREDTTRYAREDLDGAVERLKGAREAVTAFRSRYQIADLETDIQAQMGLLSTLQQQLAEALIELDVLKETTREGDPRLEQVQRRIAVIQNRIAQERSKFAAPDQDGSGVESGANRPLGEDGRGVGAREGYATLIGEFERLSVDRQFAEQTYIAALAAYEKVRAEALRKSLYLAAYIEPTLAESAEYPRRGMLLGVVALFCLMGWSILTLIYYSLRDRH